MVKNKYFTLHRPKKLGEGAIGVPWVKNDVAETITIKYCNFRLQNS